DCADLHAVRVRECELLHCPAVRQRAEGSPRDARRRRRECDRGVARARSVTSTARDNRRQHNERRLSKSHDYRSSRTTTECAGSVTVSWPFATRAPANGAGLTASGRSKVLCASILSPLRTRPVAVVALAPCRSTVTVRVAFGSRLLIVTCMVPLWSRDADALTAGIESTPSVYQPPCETEIGSSTAS